jgi:hypothetical protein
MRPFRKHPAPCGRGGSRPRANPSVRPATLSRRSASSIVSCFFIRDGVARGDVAGGLFRAAPGGGARGDREDGRTGTTRPLVEEAQ